MIKAYLLLLLSTLLVVEIAAQSVTEMRRYDAPNATQAVAVDAEHFYTISNSKIVKRRKADGEPVAEWSGPLEHLNSGIVLDGKLYCANTNYPQTPMASSLEIFDTATLEHIDSHSFGHFLGSFTWIDRWAGDYYLMFVHYGHEAKERDKGVEYTTLIRTDSLFRRLEGWTMPQAIIDHLEPMSISGGTFLSDGTLLLSPHHFEEVYLFQFPRMGYELVWKETLDVPFQGQGLALDAEDGSWWGMRRDTRQVIRVRK